MKNLFKPAQLILVVAFTAIPLADSPLRADDIEIYSGSDSVSGLVPPNIVLLLDTSGSMESESNRIYTRRADYDPKKQYPAVDKYGNTCSADTLYWTHGDDRDDTEVFDSDETQGCGNDRIFHVYQFHCRTAVDEINNKGMWYGRISQYKGYYSLDNEWVNPSTSRSHDHPGVDEVYNECYSDRGVHGKAGALPEMVDNTSNVDADGNLLNSYDYMYELKVPDDVANGSGDYERYLPDGRGRHGSPLPWATHVPYDDGSTTFREIDWVDEGTDEYNDVTVYHPNYIRYLYGYEDLNNDGDYDPGEGYADLIDEGLRIEVLQNVMLELLDEWTDVRVGIMRYNSNYGSSVIVPVMDIDGDDDPADGMTNREVLKAAVSGLTDASGDIVNSGGTPHSEAAYEVFNYYRGGPVEAGNASSDSDNHSVAGARRSTVESDPGYDQYRSPVQYTCQANFVVHMTDGLTTNDGGTQSSSEARFHRWDNGAETRDVDDAINSMPDFSDLSDSSCEFTHSSTEWDGVDTPGWDNCMDELAEYMAEKPQQVDVILDDGTVQTTIEAKPIYTYTIGFDVEEAQNFLESTATKGQGRYFSAVGFDQLKNSFGDTIEEIKQTGSTTISPPGVAVEAFSRSMHLNHLYFNLFQPRESARFEGNLKRYELGFASDGDLAILDENGNKAVDPATGAFKDTAKSYWSASPDGNVVETGGFRDRMTTVRNVYTYLGNNDLTVLSNAFHESNSAIGTGGGELELPADDLDDRDEVIQWGRGVDVFDHDEDTITDEALQSIGDPLHSRPTLVVYDANESNPENPDMLVFTMTNDGFLHAVDSRTGDEQWAFIPQETWKNLNVARHNPDSVGTQKLYGLDGMLTSWINDDNSDGIIGSSDFAYLYFGMRRGGRNYYALDVTSKSKPKYLWMLRGGDTNQDGTIDSSDTYRTLGQTWGKIQRARIDVGGTERKVLIFTGGYDTTHDSDYTTMSDSTMGNDLFIVDAVTGDLIWHAQGSDASDDVDQANMKYAMPAEPSVIDINNDSLHDRIYAVDIAGQVWRFDIQNGNSAANLVVGSRLAKLSTSGGDENRKFYNQPDVAVLKSQHGQYVSINVGSGHRAHPLNTSVKDGFFSIRDPYTHNQVALQHDSLADFSHPLIEVADLRNVTSYDPADMDALNNEIFGTLDGWYIMMQASSATAGEKVLSSSVTVNHEVLFTSYEPPDGLTADGCQIQVGTSRIYAVSLENGTATQDRDEDGVLEDDDQTEEIQYQGIAPSVVVLFPMATNGQSIGLSGTQIIELGPNNKLRRSYWYMPARDPAN